MTFRRVTVCVINRRRLFGIVTLLHRRNADDTRRSSSHWTQSQILVENRYIPPCSWGWVGSTTEYRHNAWYGKTRMVWLQYMMVKKFEDMITRCDIIHERDRQQDGRTDGQTDTSRRQRPRLCTESRRKNRHFRPISCFIACCKGVTDRFLPREVTLYVQAWVLC